MGSQACKLTFKDSVHHLLNEGFVQISISQSMFGRMSVLQNVCSSHVNKRGWVLCQINLRIVPSDKIKQVYLVQGLSGLLPIYKCDHYFLNLFNHHNLYQLGPDLQYLQVQCINFGRYLTNSVVLLPIIQIISSANNSIWTLKFRHKNKTKLLIGYYNTMICNKESEQLGQCFILSMQTDMVHVFIIINPFQACPSILSGDICRKHKEASKSKT